MQTKLDISDSVMVAGFLFWLFGYRLMHRILGEVTYLRSAALALDRRRAHRQSRKPPGTARRPA